MAMVCLVDVEIVPMVWLVEDLMPVFWQLETEPMDWLMETGPMVMARSIWRRKELKKKKNPHSPATWMKV